MDRSKFGLNLNFPDQPARVPMTDEEVEEKYEEIRRRSGVLTILGKEYKADLSDITELVQLGRGAFGVVRKAQFKKTKTLMAVKIIPITGNAEGNKRTVMDMDVIMRSHNCPHIVRCYGCFVSDSEVRICMELMSMCLDKLLKIAGPFPEKIVGKITTCVLHALNYLNESEKIMHRDVKPSNILIDNSGSIKLCDFGIAGQLIDSRQAHSDVKGSVAYLAPERVAGPVAYGIRADVWSLGITLVELTTNRHPYAGCTSEFELVGRINEGQPPRLQPSETISRKFGDFIAKCLAYHPVDRPNYDELLGDPFIKASLAENVDVGAWFAQVRQKH